ncbi:MAG: hypothetical protein A3E26_01525 [Chlamydiae bacterium RIFCSPHIGHO2_12_FULL_49_32]|nr:MAG: hypothetical protein A3E26_01525 [Chlamydiae bacterium RIFCSPHIGHO2_12_FULL_49_32]
MKLLGGIFIVAGTTIGAGMLALPVSTAFGGFFPAFLLFFLCWLIMLATSFFFLDVNLSLKGEPNFISMAGKTLGTGGKVISWIVYLLLLYSLTAAYITASTPLFVQAAHYLTGYTLPDALAHFSLPLLFGFFIYLGTAGVDQINRILMIGLILAFILLAGVIPPHIQPALLFHYDLPAITLSIPVIFTSFGYHIVIPSLTTYFKHDRRELTLAILVGSLLPLLFYLLWETLVLGVVPLDVLATTWKEGSLITEPLARLLKSPWLGNVARFFSFFAVVTSFLGVALSLSDFLTDGLKLKKSWEGRLFAILLTFIPPLFFVFAYKRAFYLALDHAGALVAILLGILPAAMAWRLTSPKFYRTVPGRLLLLTVILLSLGAVIVDILESRGLLSGLIERYL